jgi:hypothetical protein
LQQIAVAQAKVGQANEALRWVRELLDTYERTRALLGIAQGLLGIGDEEENAEQE